MAAPNTSSAMVANRYIYGGVSFEIRDSEDIHKKLASDSEYFIQYIKENFPEFPVENNASLCEPPVDESNFQKTEIETFSWNLSLTKLLLHEYLVRKEKFRNPKIKKKVLWREIVSSFKERGHNVSEDILDSKMRNMKKTYKTIKSSKASTGRERVSWDHFEPMEEIFCDDKTVNPGYTVSSFLPSNTVIPGTSTTLEPPPPSSSNLTQCTSTASASGVPADTFLANDEIEDLPELCRKATRGKNLYGLRKQQLELEKEHIDAINRLTRTIEESNVIQRERNRILQSLVDQCGPRSGST